MKHLVLVDGNSLIFRAYHATANNGKKILQNKKGVYTNALLAFIKMFEKILQKTKGYILVAFDTHKPTKRHQIYDDYKKGRPPIPVELIIQIPLIKQYLTLIGVKHHFQDEYEADDIIGTLAKSASLNNIKVLIYSSDQDLLQLVDSQITVCLIKKGLREIKYYRPQTLLEEYGLKEYQMIDYKSLVGDVSDNIKGVAGIGPKTAQKLLQTYDNLDNLIKCLEQIKPVLKTKINNSMVILNLSKQLTTIDTLVPLPFTYLETQMQPVSYNQLKNFYEEMDFRRLAITKYIRFEQEDPMTPPSSTTNSNSYHNQDDFRYKIIKDDISLNNLIVWITPSQIWSCYFDFDAITNDNSTSPSSLLGIGFSDGINNFYLDPNIALNNHLFLAYLKDENHLKHIFNYHKVQLFLSFQQQQVAGVIFDLLSAIYLLFPLEKRDFINIVVQIDILNNTNYYKQLSNKVSQLEESISLKAFVIAKTKENVYYQLKLQNQLFLFQEIELPLSNLLANLEYQNILKQVTPKKMATHVKKSSASTSKSKQNDLLESFLFQQHYYISGTRFINDLAQKKTSYFFLMPYILLKTLATLGNIQKIKAFFHNVDLQGLNQDKLRFFGINETSTPNNNSDLMNNKINQTNHDNCDITFHLSQELNISETESQMLVNQYLHVDGEILAYIKRLLDQINQNRYLETLLKRKIFFKSPLLLTTKDHGLSILYFFLQENMLDVHKMIILQSFRCLTKNNSSLGNIKVNNLNYSDDTPITYSFLLKYCQNNMPLVSQYYNYFLDIKNYI
ncbi:DNA polymerase I ['Fragaria x ananassa' phyllody phytoplasma]|uniref:5'-3' exonuclease n=1 Tax='Fragaria x ananassa' phyllody phytoplasma TaxID=2358428 RepID=A0ABS5K2P6_9MOLU|nr:5'-3' exonuclease H3TH domain-containing protein ['Fragaria x ananassa' phyllody phytoplasma]MBS2126136.1 DNA polymerase I ['Fragaria x ananassa' phyllody phytoplasma]